jgi:preprotein translocase subunit SecE
MARSSSRRTRRRRQSQSGRTNVPATQAAAAQNSAQNATPAAPDPTVTARPRRSTPRPVEQLGQGRQRGFLYRMTHPRYVIDIIDELRKVVWPSKDETRSLTTVVIIVAVAVGALLGTVDWVFNRVLENILLP